VTDIEIDHRATGVASRQIEVELVP
jgi:hypothetical protein